ncbi:hypothetical protein J6590_090921 [Homalodisca vitripennis]|nr:hypothetical protein J6590_090921 [Homalodisca vitripennis]
MGWAGGPLVPGLGPWGPGSVATCSEQGGEGPGGEGVEKSHCLRVWAMRTPGPTSDSHNHNGSRHLSPGPMVMGNDKKNKNTYFSRPGPPVAPGPYAFAPLAPPCRRA